MDKSTESIKKVESGLDDVITVSSLYMTSIKACLDSNMKFGNYPYEKDYSAPRTS